MLPCFVATGIGAALGRGAELERVAVRPVRLCDAGLCGGLVCLSLAVSALSVLAGADTITLSFTRNLAGLIGITMACHARLGRNFSAIVAVLFVLAASLFGVGSNRAVRWWAFPLLPAASITGATLAMGCLALGVVSLCQPSRR